MYEGNTLSFFENLIQPFDESMMIIDKEGTILFATERAHKDFRKNIDKKSIFKYITEEKQEFRNWLGNVEGHQSGEFHFNIIAGKQAFPMRMNSFSWPTEIGEVVLLSIKDDSEIHRTRRDILRKTLAIEHFSKSRKIRDGKLKEAIYEILEMSSKATVTKRVSVWMVDKERTRIDCLGNYDDSVHAILQQESLPRIAMPKYFKLFETEKIIISKDSQHCPVTEELRESYLVPNNIKAMMDVPIRIEGEIVGVICFENVGKERDWTLQDQKFGLISAQMVSLALETYERKKFQTKLEVSLQEQQNLFRESNHRVKNNLAIISSLIHLQEQHCKDDYHENLFRDLQNRVLSIISLHELLNKSQSYEKINFKAYINEILQKLDNSFSLSHGNIEINKHIEDVEIDISKAIPLGLIVNEIVTNSYKHAFGNQSSGHIDIEILKHKQKLLMMIKDNGIGFDFNSKKDTLGIEILKDLVDQLDGTLTFSAQGGANFSIEVDL